MAGNLRIQVAAVLRSGRLALDVSQSDLAASVQSSRSHIAEIEAASTNPTLDDVERIAERLGIRLELRASLPTTPEPRTRDAVHAWCLAYVERRLRAAGFETRREVEFIVGRSHGWADLIAFDPAQRLLVIVEVKSRLDDLGALERQLAWYERAAAELAAATGWRPVAVRSVVFFLASDEVDGAIALNREALRAAMPARARALTPVLVHRRAQVPPWDGRAIALIDPTRRRRSWLIPSRVDGRRTPAPFRNYADAAHRLASLARGSGHGVAMGDRFDTSSEAHGRIRT